MGTPATEAKKRYNKKTYDHITAYVKAGANEVIRDCAEKRGMTVAEYIRELLILDAQELGYSDAVQLIDLGGGGWRERAESRIKARAEYKQIIEERGGTVRQKLTALERQWKKQGII